MFKTVKEKGKGKGERKKKREKRKKLRLLSVGLAGGYRAEIADRALAFFFLHFSFFFCMYGTELYDWASFIHAESEEELNMVAARNPEVQKAVVILQKL